MRPLLAAGLVLVLLSVAPGAARACGHGGYSGLGAVYAGALVVAGGAVIGDLAFTLHDLGVDKSSAGAGVGESLLAAPQVVLGLTWIGASGRSDSGRVAAVAYTAWMSALFVHGIYAVVTSDRDSDGSRPHSFSEPAGDRVQKGGLGLGMTLVDVGSRSAPGLGVVGRF